MDKPKNVTEFRYAETAVLGEDNMVPEAKESGFNKVVRVPTWFVTLVKVSLPAFGVLIAGWVALQITCNDVANLQEAVPALQERTNLIERTLLKMEMRNSSFEDKVGGNLDRIGKTVEKVSDKMDAMSAAQQKLQLEMGVIKQKIEEKP